MKLIKQYTSKLDRRTLYEAWISAEMAIPPVTKIVSHPVVGGVYKLYAESPDGIGIMKGQFKKLIQHKALIYSWHWEGNEEHTLVSVVFKEIEHDEGTVITIEHTGFQSEESKTMHSSGWDSYFEKLEQKILKGKGA